MNPISDLHICGVCRNIFSDVKHFLDHQSTCLLPAESSISELFTDLPDLDNVELPLVLQCENKQHNPSLIGDMMNDTCDASSLVDQLVNEVATLETQLDQSELLAPSNEVEIDSVQETSLNEGNNKNTCAVCSFVASSTASLARHIRIHTGERPYTCQFCDKSFSRQDKLTTHKRIHVQDLRYKCQHCDYKCTDGSALRIHLRIHSDLKPHKCQMCSYTARSASNLIVHLRIHTGDCPFICQHDSCGWAFKSSSDLKRHMKVHNGTKQHSQQTLSDDELNRNPAQNEKVTKKSVHCHACEDFYRRGSTKRDRRKRKCGSVYCVKAHKCPQCPASFVRVDSLESHLRQHPTSSPSQHEMPCPDL